MKSSLYAILAAVAASGVSAHATFQELWVDGVDMGSQCVRLPNSNSPITNVASSDIRCNVGGSTGISGKCSVAPGSTVTVEMHQQPGDRSCSNEAIGGAHYGPVNVYLSKVDDASKSDGSGSWYKIFQNSWSAKSGGNSGDDDNWGTKDLSGCCGRMDVPIPADTPAGDYLLRAEVIALHTASTSGGAQFYVSCYQITVTGSGSASAAVPAGVQFPGALKASDPGILINIHTKLSTYVNPGPTVVPGGEVRSPGLGCVGCEKTCTVGSSPVGTAVSVAPPAETGATGGCAQAQYQQCGGSGYSGCTACASGSSCKQLSTSYSQCV
ncbi:glycosyl hydrolase family 61-domain-containing protein [Xylariales sp. AK1849]|nr:glycosyl hydrolase family 61-domain-containing protein [Xylariales sp. AK1849]